MVYSRTVVYADDFVLVVGAKSEDDLIYIETKQGRIDRWITNNNLTLDPEKTKAVKVRKKRHRTGTRFQLRGRTTTPRKEVKYLEV